MGRQNVSKRLTSPLLEILLRLLKQGVEATAADILLKLSVPKPRLKFREPFSQFRHLRRRQLSDGRLNLLDIHKVEFISPRKVTATSAD